jgi:endonuclease VIII
MPEGPSIYIAVEAIRPLLKGKKITAVRGNSKIEMDKFIGQKIIDVKSWGKHLLILLPKTTIRIHFLMFGSYNIDQHIKQDRSLRLALTTSKNTIFFYTCAIRLLEGDIDAIYDWEADTLSPQWNEKKAIKKLKALPNEMACDVILNQDVFAGAGNIFKNEVLFRIKLHPEVKIKNLPPKKLKELVNETHQYAFDFLKWKKAFVLRKHWLAHTKRTCPRCELKFLKNYCGKTKRRTFYCENCQVFYLNPIKQKPLKPNNKQLILPKKKKEPTKKADGPTKKKK